MRKRSLWILVSLLAGAVSGQVRIDAPIILEGSNDPSKQVRGLSEADSAHAAINASTVLSNAPLYAEPSAGQTLDVSIPLLDAPPAPGTGLLVALPEGLDDQETMIMVNGNGPFPILFAPGQAFRGQDAPSGTVLSVVFDGTAFQIMNGSVRRKLDCPAGMREMSTQYCVDINESAAPLNFFDAAVQCAQAGKRMCSWAELFLACDRRVELELNDLIGNHEWTSTTVNFSQLVRVMGYNACTSAGATQGVVNQRHFRCCISR